MAMVAVAPADFFACGGCDSFKSANPDDVDQHQLICDKFPCPLIDFGCSFVGTSPQIKKHVCVFAQCDHIPCDFMGDVKNVDKHKLDCEYKPVACRDCEEIHPYHLLPTHWDKCQNDIVKCRLCNQEGITRHIFNNYHFINCYLTYAATLKEWQKIMGTELMNQITLKAKASLDGVAWYSKYPYNLQMATDAVVVNKLRSNVLNVADLMEQLTKIEEKLSRDDFEKLLPQLEKLRKF
ncbi:MAG: hypothetical protein Hyperionvirus1_205 [Hyperionvirus sp.]|uniref:TRAF-type domain-containing protein n=1 Tax=Hyperionvirus sp. TaxID=2487770 RepID=A0A3G5A5V6_9VIRU|nr:MAG: hypothetical protein Hyperionvirus1_205 [Hyperionvirus sp.]